MKKNNDYVSIDYINEPLFRGNIYPEGFNTIRNSKIVVYGEDENEIIS